jgi:hypothetical protein
MEEGYALLNQLRGFKSTPSILPKENINGGGPSLRSG